MKVKVYGSNNCRTCKTAIKMCRLYGLDSELIPINNDEIRSDVKHKAGIKGNLFIPQVFADEKYIGNYIEFKTWIQSNFKRV